MSYQKDPQKFLTRKYCPKISGYCKGKECGLFNTSTNECGEWSKSLTEHKKTAIIKTLLSLPEHLQRTLRTLNELGEASAQEVADVTHKARAVESGYLNQLVVMGHVKKRNVKKRSLFKTGDLP